MVTKKTLTLIVALAASGASGRADDNDVASLHQVNLLADISSNFRVTLHNRVRFYNDLSDFYQYRTGPILFWARNYKSIGERSWSVTFIAAPGILRDSVHAR
jgi:hypothetical protein